MTVVPFKDLYGADDTSSSKPDASTDLQQGSDASSSVEETPKPEERGSKSGDAKSSSVSDNNNSAANKKPTDEDLSYSAQIAKQFSSYHQTPSQERQQRTFATLTNFPSSDPLGPVAIASYESRTQNISSNGTSDKVIRPSEMKDEG